MTYRLSGNMPSQSRDHQTEELRRKYFFVVEGAKTEVIYFTALANSMRKDSLTEVLILERIDESDSNQLKITQTIANYIQQSKMINKNQEAQLEDLLLKLEEEELSNKQLRNRLQNILKSKMKDLFISDLGSISEQLNTLKKLGTYSEDLDHICIIIDRDFQSFKEDQFDQVMQICEENNFLLGITNPNFEFYLLLHLTDALDLDKRGLRIDYKISNKYNYVQKQLVEHMRDSGESYKKNEYNADFFLQRFPTFKRNIAHYAVENKKLKDHIGSSLHHIVKQLI